MGGEKEREGSRDLIEKQKKRGRREEDALYKTLPLLPLLSVANAGVCVCVCEILLACGSHPSHVCPPPLIRSTHPSFPSLIFCSFLLLSFLQYPSLTPLSFTSPLSLPSVSSFLLPPLFSLSPLFSLPFFQPSLHSSPSVSRLHSVPLSPFSSRSSAVFSSPLSLTFYLFPFLFPPTTFLLYLLVIIVSSLFSLSFTAFFSFFNLYFTHLPLSPLPPLFFPQFYPSVCRFLIFHSFPLFSFPPFFRHLIYLCCFLLFSILLVFVLLLSS